MKKIKKPYFYYGWVIVVVMAIANNRDLQIAKIDVETARNDLASALANFGPTVDAAAKYSDKSDSVNVISM